MTVRTLGQTWDESGNRPAGFDYLRTALSVGVIAWHTVVVCYGQAAETWFWQGPARPFIYFLVPGFFALSGFLVAGSLARNDLPSFLTLRAVRIFPALSVEVFVSALIIGPWVTALPIAEYFSSPVFWSYLLNVFGFIHYDLPGVFLQNPHSWVNLQLWTVPIELQCYIAITALAIFGITKRPTLLFLTIAVILGGNFAYKMLSGAGLPLLTTRPPGSLVFSSFLFGVFLYVARRRIPCHGLLFVVSILIFGVAINHGETAAAAGLPAAYITVYLGLLHHPNARATWVANYSYGMYLYGFPIQQLIADQLPSLRIWYVHFPMSIIGAAALAVLSWHLIERPIMDRKKMFLSGVSNVTRAVRSRIQKQFGLGQESS